MKIIGQSLGRMNNEILKIEGKMWRKDRIRK